MFDRTPLPKEALVSLLRLCLSSSTTFYCVPADLWNSNGVAHIVMERIEDLAEYVIGPYRILEDMWMMSLRWYQRWYQQPTNELLYPPYSRELLPTVLETVWYERRGII